METAWEQCLRDFLRTMAVCSQDTSASYCGTLRRFFAQHTPDTVTRRDVEAFAYAHHAHGAPSIATINLRLSAISSFYRYASMYVPAGKTEPLWKLANPTLGIVRGKPEYSPKGLTFEELTRLFSVIPQDSLIGIRDRAVLLLVFWSARRRSEISELLYGDIQSASFPDGHGGMRQGWTYSFRSKGHKSERDSQELPQPAKNAIDWYLIASGRIQTIQSGDPLFTAIEGGNVKRGEVRRLSARGIVNRITYYAKRAGIHASLHTLRHTSAKARYESGEDIRSIQHLLRHQNLSTTDVYLRSLVGTEDPGAKLLEEKYRHL